MCFSPDIQRQQKRVTTPSDMHKTNTMLETIFFLPVVLGVALTAWDNLQRRHHPVHRNIHVWVCPHCGGHFATGRVHFYYKHYAGRCMSGRPQGETTVGRAATREYSQVVVVPAALLASSIASLQNSLPASNKTFDYNSRSTHPARPR